MQKLCFGGGQGHVRVPSPFSGFFDSVGDEQRGGADGRAQRVADYVVYLRHAEGIAVLDMLNSHTENTADERCNGDSNPAVPFPRQRIRQRQPQWEEEEYVHQHLAVELQLLPGGDDGGKRREDQASAAFRADEDRCIKYGRSHQGRQNEVSALPTLCGYMRG